MSPTSIALAVLTVSVGAALQGSVGFGLGMLSAPVLVLIDPSLVPAPLLGAALGLTILVARRERSAIDFHGVGWALIGRVPGTALGALAVAAVPQRSTALVVAAFVFVAVAIVGSGVHLRRSRRSLLFAGTLSGFMGTTTAIGGPPMAMIYQRDVGTRLRGTLSGFFVVGLVVSLTGLALIGRVGLSDIRNALLLLPGSIVGFAVSNRVAPVLDRGYTRYAVLAVSALAGTSILVRTFWLAP